jgi:hypothetical protein
MVYAEEKTFPKKTQRALPANNKVLLKYTMQLINRKYYPYFGRKIN